MTTTSEKIKRRLGELTSSNVRLEYKGDKNQVYFSVCHPNLIEALEMAIDGLNEFAKPSWEEANPAFAKDALKQIAEKLGVNAENK